MPSFWWAMVMVIRSSPPEAQPVSTRFLRQFHLCPLREDRGRLLVWMADPYDGYAIDAIRLATGRRAGRDSGVSGISRAIYTRRRGSGKDKY